MPRTSFSLLLLAAAIAASASAHAQVCGATQYHSVALTADLVCPAGVDGLVIGDHHVRIDLNGYAITSPNSVATRGIRSSGFDGIKIVGPGKIQGFDTSVMIDGGNNHEIREIDAAMVSTIGARIGIWLHNTSGSVVEGSRVGVVDLGSDPGYRASANRIVGNDADSIHVHGCQTYKNEISSNDIHPATQFQAVSLADGAKGNQVIANTIVSGSVWLGGSSENLVASNTIMNAVYPSWIYAGVIMGHFPNTCAGGALVDATRNVVRGNGIMGGHVGVAMVAGSRYNEIMDNKIYDQVAVGLRFSVDSDDNDGRGNWYSNAPVPVVDLGRRNLWP
jgi:nitrous oxidase accessory protein NosD